MLTFRRFTLFFFLILLSLNSWNIFFGDSTGNFMHEHAKLLYALLFILYFGISFALAFMPCTNFHHPVICKGSTKENVVAVTFDDGPDADKTPLILDILKNNNAPATFFCIGKHLAKNDGLLKQMFNEGHLIGNHSYSHSKWYDLFPARKMQKEMIETDRLISTIIGRSPLLFRPPFGVVNPMVSNAMKNMHWRTVCWNIRSLDTIDHDNLKIMNRILRLLEPGSIILLHDKTVFVEKCLDELLTGIRNRGFRIVPLDNLLNIPAYA